MNFFDGPLYVLYLGSEVKNDVSGQSKDALWVCNIKIKKSLLGQKQGHKFVPFSWWPLVSSDLNFFPIWPIPPVCHSLIPYVAHCPIGDRGDGVHWQCSTWGNSVQGYGV